MEQFVKKYQKELRCGITTGTCATAAAGAAAIRLLLENEPKEMSLLTPKGVRVRVAVHEICHSDTECEYMVIKDSGDDPDVTNQAEIRASVRKLTEGEVVSPDAFMDERYPGLWLDGGIGIGRVTEEGVEQRIGQAAINTVPRNMLFQMVDQVRRQADYGEHLLITVSIPDGEELAKRTFNSRLGIKGGLSVLGTSGIVEPMSEKAIVDTIEMQIRQLHLKGVKQLLVTPGNYGQGYVSQYLGLNLCDSVKCSNYIGDTIDLAVSYGMEELLLVGNVGKLVKLAAGIMNTHSKIADGRNDIFVAHAALCGAGREQLLQIMNSITTEEILIQLENWGLKDAVMKGICERIEEYMAHRIGGKMKFGVMIFSEKMGFLGETTCADELCEHFRRR